MKNPIIEILQNNNYSTRSCLAKSFGVSESTIRNRISDLNVDALKNGFIINYERGKGYFLEIRDTNLFDKYLSFDEKSLEDYSNSKQRIKQLLFILFQSEGYMTYTRLSELLNISKATIIRYINDVERILIDNGLSLEKRSHYGIKIVGPEKEFRKTFAHYVTQNKMYVKPVEKYNRFTASIDIHNIRFILDKVLNEHDLSISNLAFENIVEHICVLIYRGSLKNYIDADYSCYVAPMYEDISDQIMCWIADKYGISLPKQEGKLLAAQIAGKAFSDLSKSGEKTQLEDNIKIFLNRIDTEFLTYTEDDEMLINSLVLHVYPLINRMYNNLQLENPLIDEVYSEYANVFLLAIRFSDFIYEKYGFTLSKDEVGYIALHFAAHFERGKAKKREAIKKVIAVCMTGGGSTQLLKIKLESIFPKAFVRTASIYELQMIKEEEPDLILTTIPFSADFGDIPVIFIKEWLDEKEVSRIENIILQTAKNEKFKNYENTVLSLIKPDLFYTDIEKNDYFEILKFMTEDAKNKGYATNGYSESVLCREKKFATIYKNGVAGPHPMKFEAVQDSVSVAIFENPVIWNEREIRIIFLLNFEKGHIFLHKKISNLMMSLIENNDFLEKITKCRNYKQFEYEINRQI